jgi:hypothetical protein
MLAILFDLYSVPIYIMGTSKSQNFKVSYAFLMDSKVKTVT